MLSTDNTEAESFAWLLNQVQSEHLVEILVVGEVGQRFITEHRQSNDARCLTQHFSRPLICHVTAEVLTDCLNTAKPTHNSAEYVNGSCF